MVHQSDHCLNCREPTPEQFCARCGQKNTHYLVSFGELIEELLSELFQLDSRIARTVVPFLFRPGKLTNEFVAGRRVQYSSPLRLYLLTSFVYFFVLSMVGPAHVEVHRPSTAAASPSEMAPSWDNLENLSPPERNQFIRQETAELTRYGPLGRKVQDRLAETAELEPQKISQKLRGGLENKMPRAMFFLLPLFALLLKVFFAGSRKFYVEHLVFALHFHSFCFVVLLLTLLSPDRLLNIAAISILIYLLVALRTVYRESWLRTVTKYVVLVGAYGLSLLLGVAAVVVLTILF